MSRWSVPLDKLAERMNGDVETAVRKVTLEVFRSVIFKSPVDTGRFKANWNVSFGSPNYTVSGREDKTPLTDWDGVTKGLVYGIYEMPIGGVMYISNGLPYARRLEDGYSRTQAPQGMVRRSVAEIKAQLESALI